MDGKRTSISDVAGRAGVSISTVSRVVSGAGYPVSANARRRVLEAVEALQYRPDLAAQGLRRRSSRVIGLIVRDISEHYFGEIARGVTERALERGYLSFICNTGRDLRRELEYHELLWQHRVQGIILSGSGVDSPEYARILQLQLRRRERFGLRLVGLAPQGGGVPQIAVDYAAAAQRLTAYLLDRGHRRIGLLTGAASAFTSQDHLRGYRRALEARGVPFVERHVVHGDFTERAGWEGARELLGRGAACTAVCTGSDAIAIGAIHALGEAGLRVPADVSVTGIGDIPPARYLTPSLTTLAIPRYELGARAVDRITGEEAPAGEGSPDEGAVFLVPELVERASVRRLEP